MIALSEQLSALAVSEAPTTSDLVSKAAECLERIEALSGEWEGRCYREREAAQARGGWPYAADAIERCLQEIESILRDFEVTE